MAGRLNVFFDLDFCHHAKRSMQTSEGLERLRAARTTLGWRGAEASRMRGEVRALLKQARRLVELV